MMEVTPNEALRHMIECLSPENQYVAFHALDALEAQLAEATEAARLQRALEKKEAAGWKVDSILFPTISDEDFSCTIHRVGAFAYMPKMFRGETPAEAAEAAAAWCAGQKEGEA